MDLVWTKIPPTTPGFYWVRCDMVVSDLLPRNVSIACVVPGLGGLVYYTATAWECGAPVDGEDAEWAGPIPAPKEPS